MKLREEAIDASSEGVSLSPPPHGEVARSFPLRPELIVLTGVLFFLVCAVLKGHKGTIDSSRADTSIKSNLTINVATPLRAEPASRARLPIRISPPEAVPRNSRVHIIGLPPAAALSDGQALSASAWSVPLIALPTLAVILPAGVQGQSHVAITLMSVDGALLAEASMLLVY